MNSTNRSQSTSSTPPGGPKQALALVGLFVGCLLLSGLVGAGLGRLLPDGGDPVRTLHLVQDLSAAGSFLLPAWLFARWAAHGGTQGGPQGGTQGGTHGAAPRQTAAYLGCRPTPPMAYAWAVAAFLCLMPWTNALTAWNAQALSTWQDSAIGLFFRQMSEQNEQLLSLFLDKTGMGDLCLNLFTLALMPAVCEEFFFRGCLQTFLTRRSGRQHLSVWTGAFIFSLLHLDPVGFLPRLFLGALLGYVFAAGRSLYPGILLHFLNNAAIVVAYYLYGNGYLTQHPESFSEQWHGWSAALGLLLSVACIGLLYRQNRATPTSGPRP